MASRWLIRAALTTAAAGLALGFGPGSASAATPHSTITAEVHLSTSHTVISDARPVSAPANVHDQVTLTVTGVDKWSGELESRFFTNNDCSGAPAATSVANWDQSTPMPQDFLLPSGPLSAGEYSYREEFRSPFDDLDVIGACKPFKIAGPAHATITSEVHLYKSHTVISNANPGTAPASLHDQVTLTVTGLDRWSGRFALRLYFNNDCSGNTDVEFSVDWDESTPMPQDDLLPRGLGAGEYSYQESFDFNVDNMDAITGACEPFKIVAASSTPTPGTTPPATTTTTTTSPGLPVTGAGLTGILAAAVALIGTGVALVVRFRRRQATATPEE